LPLIALLALPTILVKWGRPMGFMRLSSGVYSSTTTSDKVAASRRAVVALAPSAVLGSLGQAAVGEEVAATADPYQGVAQFNGKPKVFVAGSTGELGRRVVLDLLRGGYAIRAGVRDDSRMYEVQYDVIQSRKSPKYDLTVVKNAFITAGQKAELEKAIGDSSVVIDCAGARPVFDVLRPNLYFDQSEAEKTDLNGTKALIDAAVAKGVKKFIYISAVLTNAKALGELDNKEYKQWNSFGKVLDFKHEAELYLQASGLDYTILRPAPMTNDPSNQVGGIWFGKPDTVLLKDGEVGYQVSRDDVSNACADAIFNPKASRGVFELVGASRKSPTPKEKWWDPNSNTKVSK